MVITGTNGSDNLLGTAGDDLIEGWAGDDFLNGMAGNDTLRGGAGNDILEGGAGYDTVDYYHATGGVSVNLSTNSASGADGIDQINGFEAITGSLFNDSLVGDGGNNGFAGLGGDDFIDGGAGADHVGYWDAASAVVVDLRFGTATGGSGSDTLVSIESVGGSAHGDLLVGNEDDNNLHGEDGDDALHGNGGHDYLVGGRGNDLIDGGGDGLFGDSVSYFSSTAGVTVNLATGFADDGMGGVDTLQDVEHVEGSMYGDALTGDNRTNWFRPDAGDDLVDGAGGADVVMYEGSASAVNIDLQAGTATGAAIGTDTLVSIEAVHGSHFGDTIRLADTGGLAGQPMAGGYVFGRGGDDLLQGGALNDNLIGGSGNDILVGGAGADSASYFDDGFDGIATQGVVVNLQTGVATDNWGNTDTLSGIEGVSGSERDDHITGSDAGGEFLNGNGGNDAIDGGAGSDFLSGGSGADTLHGGADNDTLHGDDGDDALLGELDDDFLVGGRGSDLIDGGADGMFGDTVSYFFSTAGVTVDLAGQFGDDGMGGTDSIVNVEHVDGSMHGDSLTGDGRTNWFRPHAGDDFVHGAAGLDVVMYESSEAPVNIDLQAGTASGAWIGTDTLVSIEAAHGSRFGDTIRLSDTAGIATQPTRGGYVFGRGGDDLLQGGALNDNLIGGSGNDALVGGAGADTASYFDDGFDGVATQGVVVNLQTGLATDNWGHTDTLSGIEGVSGSNGDDHITGSSAGGEFLNGNDGNDFIDGGAGNDGIQGGAGNDVLRGGAGNDSFGGGAGDDDIDGGAITDLINYSDLNSADYSSSWSGIVMNLQTGVVQDGMGGTDRLANINFVSGSGFDDQITGSNGIYFEQFDGGLGNDRIDGGTIDAFTFANANRVTYANSGSAVTVDLAAGTATGGMGSDTLVNINHVFGSRFADSLAGSDSAIPESFNGRAGDDLIDGRGGLDEVRYTNAVRAVNVNLAAGTAVDGEFLNGVIGNDTLLHIEGVRGGNFADVLLGGNAANDTFEFFMGMAGNDFIDGGSGYDRVDYNSSLEGVTVTLGGTAEGSAIDGLRVQNGPLGIDRLLNIEAVRGSNFDDALTGSDSGAFESFEGRGGNDVIDGKGGIDRADYQSSTNAVVVDLAAGTAADGWGGHDVLANIENVRGSNFDDAIGGNELANVLHGGAGADMLNGAGGADVLAGGAGNDLLSGGSGADQFLFEGRGNDLDRITDFSVEDQVLVAGTIVGRATAGNGSNLAAGAMQAATAGGMTTLYIGTDAVAGADVQIQFQGTFDPTHFLAMGTSDGYTAIALDVPQHGFTRVVELAVQIRATAIAHADVAGNVAGRSTTNELAVARLTDALARADAGQGVAGEAAAFGGGEELGLSGSWVTTPQDTYFL